ncbi:hypothetical protein P8452_35465 [Trifolium repens]|nr:hypothetical protein P8452_35465 [Trifolium repens]
MMSLQPFFENSGFDMVAGEVSFHVPRPTTETGGVLHLTGTASHEQGYLEDFFSCQMETNLCIKEEVFSDTQHLVHSILDGYNVCIFAYGQSDRIKKDIHYV